MQRDISVTFNSIDDEQRDHSLLLHGFSEITISAIHDNVFWVNEIEMKALKKRV